jgi:hypothetical protein
VSRFFPITALHYCAAVRFVPDAGPDGADGRFLPLDSPEASNPSHDHPPLFVATLRRTSGLQGSIL